MKTSFFSFCESVETKILLTSLDFFAAFIGLFLDVNLEVYNWIIENSIIDLGEKSKIELIQILGVFTGILFVFKNIYLLLINYILHKFIYNKYTKVSVRLLKKYIEMPYINHLKINSAFLQRNVNTEVFWLFANILVPGITFLTELIVVFVIVIALFYINPFSTLMLIFGFAIILLSIMFVIKRKSTTI